MAVQFALESLSSLLWNHCPDCRGIGVQFGVEYAVEVKVSLLDITRAVAPLFGVTPKFIEVRMKKYGLIQEEALAS